MRPPFFHKKLLISILSGGYTPQDVRAFVELCSSLAVPLIRSKIFRGKLNHALAGMREMDIVFDCLADLFERDSNGAFVKFQAYFSREGFTSAAATDEEVLITLRRLVFLKVQNNFVRLLSEADPALGKVLRNIRLAVRKERLLDEIERFGESFLVPTNADPLLRLTPFPLELLERQLTQAVFLHDTTNVMVRRLHGLLVEQEEYQRCVPLIPITLTFKKLFALGWENQESVLEVRTEALVEKEIERLAARVCEVVGMQTRRSYVAGRKRSPHVFQQYMEALKDILVQEFSPQVESHGTYFEILKRRMPGLTKRQYTTNHRTALEYLSKSAKKKMREELKRLW